MEQQAAKPKKNKRQIVYYILRILTIVMFIANVVGIFLTKDDSQRSRYWFNAVQTFLFILVSYFPEFLHKRAKLVIPDFMSIIFIIFCAAHFILGEVGEFFIKVKGWDTMLHTLSGAMLGILSFSILNLLTYVDERDIRLSPAFIALFAVLFSVSIGVLWEIVEFAADGLFGSNMQRFINAEGEVLIGRAALVDTMKDLIVDAIGASVTALIGYINIKRRGGAFSKWLIKKASASSKTVVAVTEDENFAMVDAVPTVETEALKNKN